MPDPFNNAKMSGDTHPPEVEPELPFEEGGRNEPGGPATPRDRSLASETGAAGGPARGVKKAGVAKDREAQTGESGGDTRKPGAGSSPSQR